MSAHGRYKSTLSRHFKDAQWNLGTENPILFIDYPD